MNAPSVALEVEVDHCAHVDGLGERSLWCAALGLLLDDARRWHNTGKDQFGVVPGTGRRALADVRGRGMMVQRLCHMADMNPEWVCWRFEQSLQGVPVRAVAE